MLLKVLDLLDALEVAGVDDADLQEHVIVEGLAEQATVDSSECSPRPLNPLTRSTAVFPPGTGTDGGGAGRAISA